MKTDCSKRTNYNMHCIKPANVFFCCGMRVDSMSEILLHLHNTFTLSILKYSQSIQWTHSILSSKRYWTL